MKNVFGNVITYTLFGESHGPGVGIVIDGLPGGIRIDMDYLNECMDRRRPSGQISTARRESDQIVFLSGVRNGFTEGTPVTIYLENNDVNRKDYDSISTVARPSHADYPADVKYFGYEDKSGGGHFSGRLTAPIVAAGSIIRRLLEDKGIFIGSHILKLHGIEDDPFSDDPLEQIKMVNSLQFAVLNTEAGNLMQQEILQAKQRNDSVGGILQTAVYGLEAGIGEPFFDSLESELAKAMFSIGGIKGIEFGRGFGISDMYGSQANDPFIIRDGSIMTSTNNSGGINGGLSNGMPIVFQCAVKPTSSIGIRQHTVDYVKMEETEIEIAGRHDPAIIHRIRSVVDAMTAITIGEMLVLRHGTLWLRNQNQ